MFQWTDLGLCGDGMTYSNAPIIEAVITIAIEPEGSIAPSAEKLEEMSSLMRPTYPVLQEIRSKQPPSQVEVDASHEAEARNALSRGYRFDAENKARVLKIWPHLFVFSHLAPYSNWNDFSDEAKSIWRNFRSCFQPKGIKFIGLRYLNRIEIPESSFEASDYLSTYPKINEDLFHVVDGFYMTISSPLSHMMPGAVARLGMGLGQPTKPGCISILLDVDTRLEGDASEELIMWEKFGRLREIKNQIFETAITQKTRELFK